MRLDQRLVADGLAQSRARAQALIRAGLVSLDGAVCRKPAQETEPSATVQVLGELCPWVSRAGLKLDYAFTYFGLDATGRIVMDLGASTGGFAEVCLRRGALKVYAIDVGRDQLHATLRDDPRVVSLEGVNAKDLTEKDIPDQIDLITADLSFISLVKALPTPLTFAASRADALLLVKPQFEVGRALVGKGGIVKDPAARAAAVAGVAAALETLGWRVQGDVVSPILGGDGNEERLLWARNVE